MTTIDHVAKIDDIVLRQNKLVSEHNKLVAIESPTRGEQTRIDDLGRAIDKVDDELRAAKLDRLTEAAARQAGQPELNAGYEPGSIRRDQETHSRARQLVDTEHTRGRLPDAAAEAVTDMLTNGAPRDLDLAERWTLAAGNEHYRGAFAKLAMDPKRGHMLFTNAEADAYRAAESINTELRALSSATSGTGAGHLIPLTLDTNVMLSGAGSISPIRDLATKKTTLSNQFKGISSAGASSEWKTEAAQAADGSPTFVEQSIPLFLADCFVPWSYEVGLSADNLLDELLEVMSDSIAQLLATAYTTGNGTTAPQGLITGLTGTASEINSVGSEAFVKGDVYAMQNALPARFSADASWLSHIAVGNMVRQFETTNGNHEFPELRDTPPSILGKPWYETSTMDSSINPAATESNMIMVYGDIGRAMTVVDRAGASVEFIDNLVGADGRPTGSRGAILWLFTGSRVQVPNAARLLDVPTAA